MKFFSRICFVATVVLACLGLRLHGAIISFDTPANNSTILSSDEIPVGGSVQHNSSNTIFQYTVSAYDDFDDPTYTDHRGGCTGQTATTTWANIIDEDNWPVGDLYLVFRIGGTLTHVNSVTVE